MTAYMRQVDEPTQCLTQIIKHVIIAIRSSLTWHFSGTRPILTLRFKGQHLFVLAIWKFTLRRWDAAFWFRPWLAYTNILEVVCPSSVDFSGLSQS